jgi:predicted Zn-dependent protease
MRPGTTAYVIPAILFVAAACATPRGSPAALSDIRPGQRPALDSDEAGLWMQMDRVERRLKASERLLTDPALNQYVRDVVCKLAGDYCPDIRVYVVQTPHFNATMMANGVMQVWAGLILRAENEAQLAYVIGHELGHYLRRHSVQRWRDVRLKSDILAFFKLLTAAAGYGFVGPLGDLVALGTVFAFSRDNEREADELGTELMVRAGYDPREAPKIWGNLVEERKAGKESAPLIFFATHPPTEERIETLRVLAEKAYMPERSWVVGTDAFLAVALAHRSTFLRGELRRRDFARSQVLLDRLLRNGPDGELHFFQGELYRLRSEEGDEARAAASYQRALEVGGAPTDTYRALGLLFMRRGERDKARSAFKQYLEQRPQAEDRQMIHSYLQQLE